MQYAAYGGLLLLLLLLFLQAFWKVAPKSHSQKYQATESTYIACIGPWILPCPWKQTTRKEAVGRLTVKSSTLKRHDLTLIHSEFLVMKLPGPSLSWIFL